MKNNNFTKICKHIIILSILIAAIPDKLFAEKISIFFNQDTPQILFAANDIKKALESKNFTVEFNELSALSSDYDGKKIVIALASQSEIITLMGNEGASVPGDLGEQAFALQTTTSPQLSYWVLGGDENGAMYGGLQIAENIDFNGFSGTYNTDESPYLKYRGIKFNIPLDLESPTYFYDNGGTSHQMAIRHVWDIEFWKTWFDEMARHRYNVLSLWSPHPFTSMLNMENEYPGIAIQGVTGYSENGSTVNINNWSIDEKVAFWQEVMKYGRDRGFGTYFCTWNIFLSTAKDKHGLSDSSNDQETRTYLRKCMINFLETYPDLAGFGVTVGERMGSINDKEKEEWAWDTYGKGMLEYAQNHPERDLVFIHRQHQGNVSDMLSYFKPLLELSNVRFDLSFKYSQAHAHAASDPGYWDRRNMEDGLGPNNIKSWLTVRNDDFYFLQWADPQFVREYVNQFPDVDKYVHAFYIGADGWVFTKEFTSKNSYYTDRDALSIQKTWYMQKIWGRISYNPSVSDDLFKNHFKNKYPEVSSDDLFEAWSNASRAIQLANEQVTGTWDLDFKWYPEGWTSKDGFLSLQETRAVDPMNGSNLCNFENTAKGNCGNKISALTNSNQIEQLANSALALIEQFSAGANTELMLNLKDLEAMSYLSLYNANKFRAAVFLEQGKDDEALDAIRIACYFWKKYTDIMDEQYIGVDLQRNKDFDNWHANDAQAFQDFYDLGGTGEPGNSIEYPWIQIKTPGDNDIFIGPANIYVDIFAYTDSFAVERIELFMNDSLVGMDNDYPYGFNLPDLLEGTYTLEAKLFDEKGGTDNSTITFQVYDLASFNSVPWIEDFTLTDETTSDTGITSWTSTRTEGNFYVQNNVFIVNGNGPAGILTTSEIDISGGPVDISLELSSQENLETDDFVSLYKIVDNGPKTLIGSKVDNQDTPTTIVGTASGNKLILVIEAKVSFSGEYYFLDNLSVIYQNGNPTKVESFNTKVKLYPNPAHTDITISAPNEYSISLINLNGVELMKKKNLTGSHKFDLSFFAKGAYLVKIEGTNFIDYKKLLLK